MAAILLLFCAGCGEERQITPVCRSARFDANRAALLPQTTVLDIGTPAARSHLIAGWSTDEGIGDGSAVWGTGPESSIEFVRFDSSGMTLKLSCSTVDLHQGSPQAVTIEINGTRVGRIVPGAARQDFEVKVPSGLTRSGRNLLQLQYRHHSQLREGQKLLDARQLAVLWFEIVFGSSAPALQRVAVWGKDGSVSIPANERIDVFRRLCPGTSIRWEGVEPWRQTALPPDARLEVSFREMSGALHTARFEGESLHRSGEFLLTRVPADGRVSFLLRSATATGESGATILKPVFVHPGSCLVRAPAKSVAEQLRGLSGPAKKPDILVYLVDTLRADRLGVYGNPRGLTPNLDALARDSVVFSNAFAQSGWTRSAVASILTGRTPVVHRVIGRDDALGAAAPTIESLLKGAGYRTLAVSTNGNVTAEFGFARDFDQFVDIPGATEGGLYIPAASPQAHAAFLQMIGEGTGAQPFFAYVHTVDPHDPYKPEESFRARFAAGADLPLYRTGRAAYDQLHRIRPDVTPERATKNLSDLYDAEVAYADFTFGQMVSELKRRGIYDSTMIVFIADHGEEFYDHGDWGHGRTLYDEIIHIPLIVKFPGERGAGTRFEPIAQQTDLLPLLCEAAGISPPPQTLSVRDAVEPTVLSYLDLDGETFVSLLTDRYHLIWSPDAERQLLFDRKADPHEQHDLTQSQFVPAGFYLSILKDEFEQERASARKQEKAHVSAETDRILKSLGYF